MLRTELRSHSLLCILALATVGAGVLTGCGGGGSSPVPSAPKTTTITVGPLATTSTGTAQPPVSAAGNGATVTGIAGTQFNDITLTLPVVKDPSQTRIVYSAYAGSGPSQIFTMPVGGGVPTQITTLANGAGEPNWSADGSKIAFTSLDSSHNSQVFVTASNGSGQPTAVSSGTLVKHRPQFTSDGTKVIYLAFDTNNNGELYSVSLSNGTTTAITSGLRGPGIGAFSLSPDGTQIAVHYADSSGYTQIFTMPITGGAMTQLTFGDGGKGYPAWSPDGSKIAYTAFDSNIVDSIFVVPSTGGTASELTVGSLQVSKPQWSADGTYLLCMAWDQTEVEQIWKVWAVGSAPAEVTFGGSSKYDPVPSPFLKPPPLKLIGASGSMGTNAAGFMVSESGQVVNSVVTFDTGHATMSSRGAARVTAQTGQGNQMPTNLIFTVTSGDGLSSLKYMNGNNLNSVIGSGGSVTTATSAVVSFDGHTGLVALVMTYSAARGVTAQPEVRGDEVTYRGSISSIVDGTGHNLAPNGASSVTVNTKTGQLVRWQ